MFHTTRWQTGQSLLLDSMSYDETAEAAVLGSILLENSTMAVVSTKLGAEDFHDPQNRDVFAAMLGLWGKRKPIDAIHLNGALPPLRYTELLEAVPTSANASHYAELVLSASRRRALAEVGRQIQALAEDADEAETALAKAEALVLGIRKPSEFNRLKKTRDELPKLYSEIEKRAEAGSPIVGRSTGIRALDDLTSGLSPTDLMVIAARPGMGKSALAMQLAINLLSDKSLAAVFFSLEMSCDQLLTRALAQLSGVDSTRIQSGKLVEHEWMRLSKAFGDLSEIQLYIDDSANQTIQNIAAVCRRVKAEAGGLALVVIDYCQLVSAISKKGVSREQEVSEVARGAKNLAKDLEAPVLLLSQLNRGLETREDKRPRLSDLRESGEIEQSADQVLFIYRDIVYNQNAPEEEAELILRKNRHGAQGAARVRFDPPTTGFSDE